MPAHILDARTRALRAVAAYSAAALVLIATRYAPSFAFLGPRGELFSWLAFATALTAGLPIGILVLCRRLGSRQPFRPSTPPLPPPGLPPTRCPSLPRFLAEQGLAWGRARRDGHWIALGLLGAVATAAVLSRAPEMRAYYPRYGFMKSEPLLWLPVTLGFAAYGLAWELLFRGFLLVGVTSGVAGGITGRLAVTALVLQTLVFATGHLDKPSLEAWLSLPAGLFFGLVALRTRSVLPGFLLHFTLATSLNLFCAYASF